MPARYSAGGGADFLPYDPGDIGDGLEPLGPLGPTSLSYGAEFPKLDDAFGDRGDHGDTASARAARATAPTARRRILRRLAPTITVGGTFGALAERAGASSSRPRWTTRGWSRGSD